MQAVLLLLLAALQPNGQIPGSWREVTPAETMCSDPEGLPLLACVGKAEAIPVGRLAEAPVKETLDRLNANRAFLDASDDWRGCLSRYTTPSGSEKFDMEALAVKAVRKCRLQEQALVQAYVNVRANEHLVTPGGEREKFRKLMRAFAMQGLMSPR
jgi:hypothetical protein